MAMESASAFHLLRLLFPLVVVLGPELHQPPAATTASTLSINVDISRH